MDALLAISELLKKKLTPETTDSKVLYRFRMMKLEASFCGYHTVATPYGCRLASGRKSWQMDCPSWQGKPVSSTVFAETREVEASGVEE
jgi:hypothetical protein